MEDSGGTDEVARVGVENETGESTCERIFTVGEVVEYWAGAFVRGRRLGSGEPAFVKRVEGKGVYAIKMVGSSRGKFRLVGWESLFRDGSFNKNVARVDGPRVRGRARLEERAKEEAEAKLGAELRETKRKLQNAEKNAEERLKVQEMEVRKAEDTLRRQENEARKAERDLTVVHKRQLDKMLQENRRETRKCMRLLRQDLTEVTEQVGV
jgi:hypothetical protein